jgi:hypothetical protein
LLVRYASVPLAFATDGAVRPATFAQVRCGVNPGCWAGTARPVSEPGRRRAKRIRVVGRDAVRVTQVHVEADDLAEDLAQIQSVVVGIAGGTAVTQRKVEEAVVAEAEGAAVVVGERVLFAHENVSALRIGQVRVVGGDGVLDQEGIAIGGVVGG